MSSWHGAYLIKHRNNFTFTLHIKVFMYKWVTQITKIDRHVVHDGSTANLRNTCVVAGE
jgi:hypothetical protein